jgi:hypothetical protein
MQQRFLFLSSVSFVAKHASCETVHERVIVDGQRHTLEVMTGYIHSTSGCSCCIVSQPTPSLVLAKMG